MLATFQFQFALQKRSLFVKNVIDDCANTIPLTFYHRYSFTQYAYQDVQTAKMVATGDAAKFDTKHLFDKYLSTESPSEVNISSSLKTRISTLINVNNGCGAVEPSEIKHQELFQSLESAQAEVKVT
jgi:hypothetical protein